MADAVTVETIRGWLSTGFLGGNLLLLSKLVPAGLQYLKDARADKLAEKADDRAGWGDLIDTMGAQIKALTEREHECEGRIRAMRDDYEGRLRTMSGEIDGLRRMIVTNATVKAVPLSPLASDAAERSMQHMIDRMDQNDGNG